MAAKRKDRRVFRATVNDGRGIGRVWVEDGYGRRVTERGHEVVGVHTEAEAIAAARAEGFGREFDGWAS